MALTDLKSAVLKTAHSMVQEGIAYGSQGNVSVLDRETELVLITPSAIPYDEMCIDDIVTIDKSGKVIEGNRKPTSEVPLHLIFYNRRPDVGAVVHCHAPYATVFAGLDEEIPIILTEAAAYLSGPVPVAPYCKPGTADLAEIAFSTMGNEGVAVLLSHHGLITVGLNLDHAFDATRAAEEMARLVVRTRSMNMKPKKLDPEEAQYMRNYYLKKYRPDKK